MRSIRLLFLAMAALMVPSAYTQCAPVQMTNAQARQRMMDLLHI